MPRRRVVSHRCLPSQPALTMELAWRTPKLRPKSRREDQSNDRQEAHAFDGGDAALSGARSRVIREARWMDARDPATSCRQCSSDRRATGSRCQEVAADDGRPDHRRTGRPGPHLRCSGLFRAQRLQSAIPEPRSPALQCAAHVDRHELAARGGCPRAGGASGSPSQPHPSRIYRSPPGAVDACGVLLCRPSRAAVGSQAPRLHRHHISAGGIADDPSPEAAQRSLRNRELQGRTHALGRSQGGPVLPDDGIKELYLTYPAWWDDAQQDFVETSDEEAAVLVWIDGIHNITVSEDRTL